MMWPDAKIEEGTWQQIPFVHCALDVVIHCTDTPHPHPHPQLGTQHLGIPDSRAKTIRKRHQERQTLSHIPSNTLLPHRTRYELFPMHPSGRKTSGQGRAGVREQGECQKRFCCYFREKFEFSTPFKRSTIKEHFPKLKFTVRLPHSVSRVFPVRSSYYTEISFHEVFFTHYFLYEVNPK